MPYIINVWHLRLYFSNFLKYKIAFFGGILYADIHAAFKGLEQYRQNP